MISNKVGYPGGALDIQSQTPRPAAMPQGNPQMDALLQMMIARQQPKPFSAGPRAMSTQARREPRMINLHKSPRELTMQKAEDTARLAQLNALSGQQPLRMVSGPGITPGYMPDVNAMSGAQRKVFLPDQSSMNASGAADDSSRAARNQGGFQNFMDETAQRNAIAYPGEVTTSGRGEPGFLEQQRRRGGLR